MPSKGTIVVRDAVARVHFIDVRWDESIFQSEKLR